MPKLTNGHAIETLSDYQEKQRRARKVTIGEIEDMATGLLLSVKEVTDELLRRTDALMAHTGYVPPADPKQVQIDAVMDAQKQGLDT